MAWKFWNKKKQEADNTASSISAPKPDINEPKVSPEQEAANEKSWVDWYDKKTAMMVKVLGEEHDSVMHAIISYDVGGALHSYFYPNGIEGTGVATKQLARLDIETDINEIYGGNGPTNDMYEKYEFVIFTKEDITGKELSDDPEDMFFKMRTLLQGIAGYSEQATLNNFETLSYPDDWDGPQAGRTVIFDAYKHEDFDSEFGLMLIMEIFPSELEYKEKHGGDKLLARLKEAGHYPYSDLDREPVA